MAERTFMEEQFVWIVQHEASVWCEDGEWHVRVDLTENGDWAEVTAKILDVAIMTAKAAKEAHYYGK